MVTATLDSKTRILHLEPHDKLTEKDFQHICTIVDPFLEAGNLLRGVLLIIPNFPGWEDFSGMIEHLKFVHDHHRKVKKVALVTDGRTVSFIADHIANHFIAAEVKHFSNEDNALTWINS